MKNIIRDVINWMERNHQNPSTKPVTNIIPNKEKKVSKEILSSCFNNIMNSINRDEPKVLVRCLTEMIWACIHVAAINGTWFLLPDAWRLTRAKMFETKSYGNLKKSRFDASTILSEKTSKFAEFMEISNGQKIVPIEELGASDSTELSKWEYFNMTSNEKALYVFIEKEDN